MTNYPSLVAEFIQYDDAETFDPIILQCAVTDLVKAENYCGKLTAIVRYWKPYTFTDDWCCSFSVHQCVSFDRIMRSWYSNLGH